MRLIVQVACVASVPGGDKVSLWGCMRLSWKRIPTALLGTERSPQGHEAHTKTPKEIPKQESVFLRALCVNVCFVVNASCRTAPAYSFSARRCVRSGSPLARAPSQLATVGRKIDFKADSRFAEVCVWR